MENYIQQLLKDLEAAKHTKPVKIDFKVIYPNHPSWDYEGLEGFMEWEFAPYYTFEDLFNIPSTAFPPGEQLTDKQVKGITQAILDLWHEYSTDVYAPDGVSLRILYQALVEYWTNEKFQYITEGHVTIELCHYEPSSCRWGYEHCTCKTFESDDINSNKTN